MISYFVHWPVFKIVGVSTWLITVLCDQRSRVLSVNGRGLSLFQATECVYGFCLSCHDTVVKSHYIFDLFHISVHHQSSAFELPFQHPRIVNAGVLRKAAELLGRKPTPTSLRLLRLQSSRHGSDRNIEYILSRQSGQPSNVTAWNRQFNSCTSMKLQYW